ncbi:MAG: phosphotransferase [Candidatus Hodarchaeales archaeon]
MDNLEEIGYTDIKEISRKNLDSSPFTRVEIIQVETPVKKTELICKSLLPELFRDEVSIHRAVNKCAMNGPEFYYGVCDSISCYIIMEKVDFKFLYNFLDFNTLKEVVKMLTDFQNDCYNSNILNLPLKRHGIEWYTEDRRIDSITSTIEKMVEKEQIKDENLEPISTIRFDTFKNSLYKLVELIKEIPKPKCDQILVHGDFDSGNIIIFDNHDQDIAVIDWGMGHFDNPILDISHLFSSLQGLLPVDQTRELINYYFKSTSKFWHKNIDRFSLIRSGQIMHHLYYLMFQTKAIKNNWVEPTYYSETIYRKFRFFHNLIDAGSKY